MGFGRDLISLVVTFFLAGFFAGWIVVPSRLGGWDRLFISLALSVPATLLAAAPGVATHSLAAWNVTLGIVVLGAVASWRMRNSASRFPQPPADSAAVRIGRPRIVPTILIGLALVVTWFTVLVPEGVENTAGGHPNGTIVYYHWGIVGRVVEAEGLPATLPEWGRQREFPYEYAFSVIHGASTASLAGGAGFVLEERYRIAMVIVGDARGVRALAPLASIVVGVAGGDPHHEREPGRDPHARLQAGGVRLHPRDLVGLAARRGPGATIAALGRDGGPGPGLIIPGPPGRALCSSRRFGEGS